MDVGSRSAVDLQGCSELEALFWTIGGADDVWRARFQEIFGHLLAISHHFASIYAVNRMNL